MGMFRHLVVAVALSAALAACSSEAATPPAPSHSASAGPSTSSVSPSPAPPVMPEAAKAHTEDGAKAFVMYYWQTVDYADATLDTTLVRAASAPSCTGCAGGIEGIEQTAEAGGTYVGGISQVKELRSDPVLPNSTVTLAFTLTNTRQEIRVPGKQTVVHPKGATKVTMTLAPRSAGWLVTELNPS